MCATRLTGPGARPAAPARRRRSDAGDEEPADRRPAPPNRAVRHAGLLGLAVAALGVVFGDIGTSPLYALQTVFAIDNGAVRPTTGDVYGVISLVFWSITLIVSIKYVTFVMRADRHGEGGVMALATLVRRALGQITRRGATLVTTGVFGACLFYGDSVITPAISVLSAVEGLDIAAPALTDVVLPVAATIIAVLFAVQRWGTGRVGTVFGPVMLAWFATLACAGLREVIAHPGILAGLAPSYAVLFAVDHPYISFIAMGAVVLAITGAEALYADMGHFGRPPIRRAWFFVVFPALTLNYLGQGALIVRHRAATASPFFLLLPGWARIPMVVLATLATVIASQAVISGAYSVSRQAVGLGFLPRLTVRHTSEHEEGQVYVPAVNWLLMLAVLTVMLGFGSSTRLATAYGVAVTGTFVITTVLFLVVAHGLWRWQSWQLVLAAVLFGGTELVFFAANVTKVFHGGWLPLLVAAAVFTAMVTWQRGRELVTQRRTDQEGTLGEFLRHLRAVDVRRVPGTAVFPHATKKTTPIAMRANVEHNHVLHEKVLIVTAQAENMPHVAEDERLAFDELGYADDGIAHLTARYGFQDRTDIPGALRLACRQGILRDIDVDNASYFLSRITIRLSNAPGMSRWRKHLFIGLAHNAAEQIDALHLPTERTVVMGSQVGI